MTLPDQLAQKRLDPTFGQTLDELVRLYAVIGLYEAEVARLEREVAARDARIAELEGRRDADRATP